MNISIVICTYKRYADLEVLLLSISKQKNLPYEIIIVDSTPGSNKFKHEIYLNSSIKYFKYNNTPSLVKQRNYGAQKSTGDIILFLDDDVILDHEYLSNLAKFWENADKSFVGVSGIDYMQQKNKFKYYILLYYGKLFWGNTTTKVYRGIGPTIFPLIKTQVLTNRLSGCNMAYKKKIFEYIHFDEYFSGYSFGEDVDFSFLASKLGALVWDPNLKFIHNKSSFNRLPYAKLMSMIIKNIKFISEKHFGPIKRYSLKYFWGIFGYVIFYFVIFVYKYIKNTLLKIILFFKRLLS